MTGRDLILYILTNGLEDEPIFDSNTIFMENLGFMPMDEVAVRMNVGFSTVIAWMQKGVLNGYNINNALYVEVNSVQALLDKTERKE